MLLNPFGLHLVYPVKDQMQVTFKNYCFGYMIATQVARTPVH